MNYSPQNEQSLLDLIEALKGGLDPGTAMGLYQGVQQDQAQRIANRQDRLGGLAELLTGAATSGMPYEGAQALAAAQPGPAGPAVQSMLQGLYPTAETGPIATGLNGQPLDFPNGSRPTQSGFTPPSPTTGMQYQVPQSGPQAMSPAAQVVPPSPTEQIAMQGAEQQMAIQQAAQSFAVDASKKASEGMTMQDFLIAAAPLYPELYSTPEGIKQVQQIAVTVFGNQTPV